MNTKRTALNSPPRKSPKSAFNVQQFLDAVGAVRQTAEYRRNQVIYAQGDPSTDILYIKRGGVRISIVNENGKEAVVAVLAMGDFFGEACLAGQDLRIGTATAITPTTVMAIEKREMIRVLHTEPEFSDRFISFVLERNIRVEEDLADQLFNSSEKRLARTLLLLTHIGNQDNSQRVVPKISQEILAEMVGTTRSRVNFFMNKFRRLGFIKYNGGDVDDELLVDSTLLSVVMRD